MKNNSCKSSMDRYLRGIHFLFRSIHNYSIHLSFPSAHWKPLNAHTEIVTLKPRSTCSKECDLRQWVHSLITHFSFAMGAQKGASEEPRHIKSWFSMIFFSTQNRSAFFHIYVLVVYTPSQEVTKSIFTQCLYIIKDTLAFGLSNNLSLDHAHNKDISVKIVQS